MNSKNEYIFDWNVNGFELNDHPWAVNMHGVELIKQAILPNIPHLLEWILTSFILFLWKYQIRKFL